MPVSTELMAPIKENKDNGHRQVIEDIGKDSGQQQGQCKEGVGRHDRE